MNRKFNVRAVSKAFRGKHTANTVPPVVESLADGDEAVEAVRDSIQGSAPPIHAILMDNLMVRMNGPDAATGMRALGYKGVIIGVTGNVNTADIDIYTEAGANNVLQKPIDISVLATCLANKLSTTD